MKMTDFSARSQTLRSDERIKHFVGVITALGTAVMIAAFARISLRGAIDLLGLAWLVGAAMTIWFSPYPLDMLEAEDRDD